MEDRMLLMGIQEYFLCISGEGLALFIDVFIHRFLYYDGVLTVRMIDRLKDPEH